MDDAGGPLLSADTTDFLSTDTTDVMSANTADLGETGPRWLRGGPAGLTFGHLGN